MGRFASVKPSNGQQSKSCDSGLGRHSNFGFDRPRCPQGLVHLPERFYPWAVDSFNPVASATRCGAAETWPLLPLPVPVFIGSETEETRAIDVLPEYRKRQRCKDRNQPGPGAGKGTVKIIAPGVSPVSNTFYCVGGKGGLPVTGFPSEQARKCPFITRSSPRGRGKRGTNLFRCWLQRLRRWSRSTRQSPSFWH